MQRQSSLHGQDAPRTLLPVGELAPTNVGCRARPEHSGICRCAKLAELQGAVEPLEDLMRRSCMRMDTHTGAKHKLEGGHPDGLT
eukprot:848311-Amphidinium_carterae.1